MVLGLSALHVMHEPTHPLGTAPVTPATDIAEASPKPVLGRGHSWTRGASQMHDFQLRLSFTPDADEPLAAQAAMDWDITGTLGMIVLAVDRSQVTVAMGLSGVQVLSHGRPAPALGRLIGSHPCVLDLGLDGSVRALRWHHRLAEEDRRFLSALYRWPFVLRAGANSWSTIEADETGTFTAQYTVSAGGVVSKTRRSLPPQNTPAVPVASQVTGSSLFHGTPGPLWLEKLCGEERTRVTLNGRGFGHSHLAVSFVRSEAAELPAMLAALAGPAAALHAFSAVADASAVSQLEQSRLEERRERHRGQSVATVLQPLRESLLRSSSHADALPALEDLVDWLVANPVGSGQLVTAMKHEGDANLTALLAHALETAGTAESQEALAAALENPHELTTPALLQCIVAVSGLDGLRSERIVPALRGLVAAEFGGGADFEVNDTALFAMAQLARGDAALREELTGALVPRLDPAESPEDIRTSLLALQNAEIAQGRAAAEALAATHADPLVRETATAYLASLTAAP